jgi:ATP-binding cassette subfamily G (WHITE) protein 2
MSKEEKHAWMANYLVVQRQMLANFDPDNIERDEMVKSSKGASIAWKNVSFAIKVHDPVQPKAKTKISKIILEECEGHAPAGSLTALMGPSGCGKSTLLDILAGKKNTPYNGTVLLNGHDMKSDPMSKRIVAYVGQTDIMPPHWTVREAITFNGLLKKCVPKGMAQGEVKKFFDSLIEDVGLLHVAETKIGGTTVRGISGGQRRRVSLARGMAANPHVMFCDEPTSGLSATDAEACVKALKLLVTRWGLNCIVVIHQPRIEVAQLFDQLVLLTSQPGRVVYNGPMSGAAAYWEIVGYPAPPGANPADHFLDLITPGAPKAVPDVFREHYVNTQKPGVLAIVADAEANKGPTPLDLLNEEREMFSAFGVVPPVQKSIYGVSFVNQLSLVLKRKVKLSLIDTDYIGTVIGAQVCLGIFIGVIYFDVGSKEPKGFSQLGYLFLFVNMALTVPMFTMPSIITWRDIMKLECLEALYNEWAHIIASTIVDTVISLFGFIVMCVVMYAMSGMSWDGFAVTVYWSFLNYLMMDSLSAMFSAMSRNVEQANALLLPLQMIVMLFNGLTLTKKSAPEFLRWALYVSPLSLAMEGMAWEIYGDDNSCGTAKIPANCWDEMRKMHGYDKGRPNLGLAICLALTVLGRLGQLYALKYMNNIEK